MPESLHRPPTHQNAQPSFDIHLSLFVAGIYQPKQSTKANFASWCWRGTGPLIGHTPSIMRSIASSISQIPHKQRSYKFVFECVRFGHPHTCQIALMIYGFSSQFATCQAKQCANQRKRCASLESHQCARR
jgi:hypothetical protein